MGCDIEVTRQTSFSTKSCFLFSFQLEESEQHRASLEEKVQLMKDLEEKLADSEVSRATEEEISKELQEQVYHTVHTCFLLNELFL